MGNHVSFRPSDSTGKVIFLDGSVHEFDEQITVAELMMDHPQKVVVEFQSAVNQKRPTPLPADKKLEMKKIYLMLPVKQGKPIGLSSQETRRVLLMVNSVLNSNYVLCSSKFLPWFSSLCHSSGIVEPQRKEDVEEEEKKGEGSSFSENLPDILEGRPEFLNRQISRKGSWKPSLDTIKEKIIEKKHSHWLFLKSSSGSNFSFD
ncbi:uncharacterized protein LOC123906897 [Trifolium pratense]|uniref:Uncharacterized protein n=2 Tax=Trifolium pratense TaxID=57577 RepID=A0ACB0IAF8_TRIPR|nr:uncharacterized protein LOC123906897 [Trifolium pratense]CAJ2629047.1 unnamed protein product [Trifolium pratense]